MTDILRYFGIFDGCFRQLAPRGDPTLYRRRGPRRKRRVRRLHRQGPDHLPARVLPCAGRRPTPHNRGMRADPFEPGPGYGGDPRWLAWLRRKEAPPPSFRLDIVSEGFEFSDAKLGQLRQDGFALETERPFLTPEGLEWCRANLDRCVSELSLWGSGAGGGVGGGRRDGPEPGRERGRADAAGGPVFHPPAAGRGVALAAACAPGGARRSPSADWS